MVNWNLLANGTYEYFLYFFSHFLFILVIVLWNFLVYFENIFNQLILVKQRSLNQANDAKEEGNKLFKAGKYGDALLQYELALQIASEVPSSEVCSICHANRAVCFLKLVGHFSLIYVCTWKNVYDYFCLLSSTIKIHLVNV